jgi:hypothetical protein
VVSLFDAVMGRSIPYPEDFVRETAAKLRVLGLDREADMVESAIPFCGRFTDDTGPM